MQQSIRTKSNNITSQRTPYKLWNTIWRQKYLFLMSFPFVIWVIIFKYFPLWGWLIAFQDYKPGVSFFSQAWVGLKWFNALFQDRDFFVAMRNTVMMSLLSLLFGFTAPIILALMLNEVRAKLFKRTVQTVSYLPHFVSWVIVASMFSKMLSTDNGIINNILVTLHIIKAPVQFLAVPHYFWWIVTFADVWKEIGWNSIIFLAAIAGISPELYEAAIADGAGRFRRIWHVTLPSIMPTIIVILIMNIGNFINIGFEKQFLMRNSLVVEYANVIDLFILDNGVRLGRFAFGTAAGIFKSFISVALLVSANTFSKRKLGIRIM